MKQAVCLLMFSDKGNVLGVTRRNSPDQWGMPGGKVDDIDANILEALQREIREETGIYVLKASMIPLHSAKEGDFWVTTFLYPYEFAEREGSNFTPEDGLIVDWISPKILLTSSPFAKYNQDVLLKSTYHELS